MLLNHKNTLCGMTVVPDIEIGRVVRKSWKCGCVGIDRFVALRPGKGCPGVFFRHQNRIFHENIL